MTCYETADRLRDAELQAARERVLDLRSRLNDAVRESQDLRERLRAAERSARIWRGIVWFSFWCSLAAAILRTM